MGSGGTIIGSIGGALTFSGNLDRFAPRIQNTAVNIEKGYRVDADN
jgi:hypothetical protein